MTYVSTCLADGAVGLYALSETAFAQAVADQAAIQNGVYVNTAGLTFSQTGIPGGGANTAVRFTAASSGYATIASVTGNHVANIFTREAWVKRASISTVQVIWGATTNAPQLSLNAANQIEATNTFNVTLMDSTVTLTDTASFHHIVWTHSGSTDKLYLDGADVTGTVLNTATFANSSYTIGADFGGGSPTQFFDGTLAMAANYPTALTSGQVSTHYTLGSASAPAATMQPYDNSTAWTLLG